MALPLRCSTRALTSIVNNSSFSNESQLPINATSPRTKSSNNNPVLPKYTDVKHIAYAEFVEKLRFLNPDTDMSQQREIHEALKSAFREIIGWKQFNHVKLKRLGQQGPTRHSSLWEAYNSWERLLIEEKKYFATPDTEPPRSASNKALRLPEYSRVADIQDDGFVEQLQDLNQPDRELSMPQIHAALRDVVAKIIGQPKLKRWMGPDLGGRPGTQWARLMDEAARHRRSRKRS